MKIAILEICASTHYTLTNALIKTYSTNPDNQIVVYTSAFIAKVIQDGGVSKNTQFVVFDPSKKAADFLQKYSRFACLFLPRHATRLSPKDYNERVILV